MRAQVLKFKAQSLHRTLLGGMSDVAAQFADGMMRQLRISPALSHLEKAVTGRSHAHASADCMLVACS